MLFIDGVQLKLFVKLTFKSFIDFTSTNVIELNTELLL